MEKIRRVAVIAGTPVDTRMGVEYLERRHAEKDQQNQRYQKEPQDQHVYAYGAYGTHAVYEADYADHTDSADDADSADMVRLHPLYRPAAEDCDAQVRFQYMDMGSKREVIDAIFDPEISEGTSDFFIYCNSLSGAFEFDTYALEKSLESDREIRVYTPLQVYRNIGREYSRIGVMASHNLSAHAIEEALLMSNPDICVIGTGNIAVVRAIEEGIPPAEIVSRYGLKEMADYMKASGAEAILLGCTHFPYFAEELAAVTDLPLIDPADRMYEALCRN